MVAATAVRRAAPHWALVLAAFLFGACVAAALFVGVWRHEAGRAKTSDRALAFAQVEAETAARKLASTAAQLKRAEDETLRQAEILARLPGAGKPILAEAGKLEGAARALAAEGAELSESVSRLTGAVATLNGYLRDTSAAQLDPAYVQAQLAYLEETLASLRARADGIAAEAAALASSRQALAKKTAALQRLAESAGS